MVSAGAPMNPRLASSKSRVSANGSRACQLRLAAAVVGVACSEVEALGAGAVDMGVVSWMGKIYA